MSDAIRANSFLIAARALNGVIGDQGRIPWHAPQDLLRFKALTTGTAMVMGRATWDSLPGALPGRTSIVVTSRPLHDAKPIAASSFDKAIEAALALPTPVNAIAFIGGTRIYEAALRLDWLRLAYITTVHIEPTGDAYFPELGSEWSTNQTERSDLAQRPICEFARLTRDRSIS